MSDIDTEAMDCLKALDPNRREADIGSITRCARKEARRRLLGGKVADLTANLSRRELIRVDVSIDRVAVYGGEQRVEILPRPREIPERGAPGPSRA